MNLIYCLVLVFATAQAFGAEAPPTGRKQSLSDIHEYISAQEDGYAGWLWNDQVKPTVKSGFDTTGLSLILGMTAATVAAHQEDEKIRNEYGDNKGVKQGAADVGAVLGSGGPGIAIALFQLYADPHEGLAHGRALALTAGTHISIALAANRKRPNGKTFSFPSGHMSSSFATATSLAYSYGPLAGVPAYALASWIGFTRIANNAHWLSDLVLGAGLGLFWGRASANADSKPSATSYFPVHETQGGVTKWGMGFKRSF